MMDVKPSFQLEALSRLFLNHEIYPLQKFHKQARSKSRGEGTQSPESLKSLTINSLFSFIVLHLCSCSGRHVADLRRPEL